jgi:hypothetical protein
VTVDNTANATSALAYHQTTVKLTGAAYTSFAAHAKADGSDVRVTDADGTTLLSFALEGIDAANSTVYLLVKVPRVAAGATSTIYVYYGNAAAASTSSYSNAIGPNVALVGPTDVFTQTDAANFNFCECLLLLQNQGGINGGGAGLNGRLLCFHLAGANSNADRTNGSIGMMMSTDGGVTWGSKTIILAHDATRMCEPRAACELADGTILLIYSADTPANASASKSKQAVAKLVGGPVSGTWSNLALAPASLLSVPWTYGTDTGNPYHTIFTDPSGNLYAPAYGKIAADTGRHSWLLTCAAASDPAVGTNWTLKGTIAFDNVLGCSETAIAVLGGGNLVAVMRNDIPGASPGLRTCSSTNWGATWTSPVLLGEPGTSGNLSVSPEITRLASGNYLLCWGMRYGTDWSIGAMVSTDNCASWLDRAPAAFVMNAGQTTGDGGYPNTVQLADGTIVCLYFRVVGGVVATCNIVRTICTEDWVCNSPNLYDGCESLAAFTAGANATISTTHVHNGTNAIKIDNSSGTGGTGDYLLRNWWSANPALQGQRIAFSYWSYETANDSTRAIAIKDSTGVFNNAVGNRIGAYVLGTASDHLSWYDGAAQHDTGVVVPPNQWNKLALRAYVQPASVTGELRLNGASVTTGLGQYGSGGNPQMVFIVGGSVGSTHNTIYWLDDVYTHQYTANIPVATAGSEQMGAAGVATLAPDTVVASAVALLPTQAAGVVTLRADTVVASAVAAAPGGATATGSFTLRADTVTCTVGPYYAVTPSVVHPDPYHATTVS